MASHWAVGHRLPLPALPLCCNGTALLLCCDVMSPAAVLLPYCLVIVVVSGSMRAHAI